MSNYVNERERGKFPLSIGTSLAFESFANQHEEITHPRPPYEDYDVIWVNLKSLFRNLYGAIGREEVNLCSTYQFVRAMQFEMSDIRDIAKNELGGIEVVFYVSNYQGLERINAEVLPRMDNTTLQKQYTKRMSDTIRMVLSDHNNSLLPGSPERIRVFENEVTPTEANRAIMFTSFPYDLIHYSRWRKLALLEGHTGKIKTRELWYTKYYDGRKLPEMPFRLDLLTIMGDNNMFRCKVPAFRKELIELAKRYKWSAITDAGTMRAHIKTIKNHHIMNRLLAVIK